MFRKRLRLPGLDNQPAGTFLSAAPILRKRKHSNHMEFHDRHESPRTRCLWGPFGPLFTRASCFFSILPLLFFFQCNIRFVTR